MKKKIKDLNIEDLTILGAYKICINSKCENCPLLYSNKCMDRIEESEVEVDE